MTRMYDFQLGGICLKELIRGDYVYGACHDCAKRAITQRLKDRESYVAMMKRHEKERVRDEV